MEIVGKENKKAEQQNGRKSRMVVSCTLSPASYLLHPISCTLSPAPYLLHPISCILSPASYLLHPISCFLFHSPIKHPIACVCVITSGSSCLTQASITSIRS